MRASCDRVWRGPDPAQRGAGLPRTVHSYDRDVVDGLIPEHEHVVVDPSVEEPRVLAKYKSHVGSVMHPIAAETKVVRHL